MTIIKLPQTKQYHTPEFSLSQNDNIDQIKKSTNTRSSNNRDNLTQAMLAGCALIAIKESLKHGEWGVWLQDNIDDLGYGLISQSPIRAAQYDMRLWKQFNTYREQLAELNLYADPDAYDVVETLDNRTVTVVLSAFYELARPSVPDVAIDMALKRLLAESDAGDEKHLSLSEAKQIGQYAKAMESLDGEDRQIAQRLFDAGLSNPAVVPYIPQMSPDVVSEMLTGQVYLTNLDRQVPIHQIGVSDIEIVIQTEETEKALEYIGRNKGIVDETKTVRSRNFKQGGVIEGTPAQIQNILRQDVSKHRLVRVVWYFQDDETDVV